MGLLTCSEIIEQGMELAGVPYDANDAKQLKWLKQWLRSVVLGWPWNETIAVGPITLSAGEYYKFMGTNEAVFNGLHIHRIMFPLKLDLGPDTLSRDIVQMPLVDTKLHDSANIPTGMPTKASYSKADGRIQLFFNTKAKQDYTIQVSCQFDPAFDYNGDNLPWYPNDDTLIHVIALKNAEYSEGKDASSTQAFMEDLSIMLRNDKVKFGNIDYTSLPLSRKFGG
jgi:hypothetical protein